MSWLRRNSLLLAIIIIAFVLRFAWLDNVPTSTNFDQLHYFLDAKSFFVTGKDISGTVSLLDIFMFHYPAWAGMQAELPYLLVMFSVGPFGFSLAHAALPNVFLSTATVILLYFLGRQLGNHRIGLIAAFLGAINPWLIFSGRTGYEVAPAMFFYLLTLFLLLRTRDKYLLLAIPAMFLAFYSYIGTKLIFLPFILICLAYSYFVVSKQKYSRYYLIILLSACVLVAGFIFQLSTQPTSRVSDIFLPNNPHVREQVNSVRQASLSSPITNIFENKLTIYGRTLLANIFNLLSPQYLFGTGDFFFSLGRHGLFYYLDGLFLLIGGIRFFSENRKRAIFFGSLLVVAMLPHVFHDPKGSSNFTPHITLFIPLILFIIAFGIETSLKAVTKKLWQNLLSLGILVIYALLTTNFLHLYFHQFPLSGNIFVFPNRVLSTYVSLSLKDNQRVIVHASNPLLTFREYLFYSNSYSTDQVAKINALITTKNYSLGSVTFVQCTSDIASGSATVIYEALCNQKNEKPYVTIAHLKDSGSSFTIFNDKLCKDVPKRSFIADLKVSDLNVEKLNPTQFCEKFIISY